MRGFGRADPTGSKMFLIVVGVALVGIGVAQWRSERAPKQSGALEPDPPVVRPLPPAIAISAGLIAIVAMTAALLAEL